MTLTPQALSPQARFQRRVLPFVLVAMVLVALPFLTGSRGMISLMNLVGINIVFALSYNMLLGQSGMLSFGHAVYFGFGGYAALHAMNAIEEASYDGGLWASAPVFCVPIIGFAGGALAGAIIGWPSCRRAGTTFAMISLGIAELVAAAGYMFTSVFGGEEGVSADRMNGIELFGLSLGPVDEVYWFIAFWTLVGLIGAFAFTRTPLGRMAQAVRDNPERAEFVGYDPQKVRYLTFIAAGGFAGMAGGMSAVNFEIFTPEAFSAHASGAVLLMAYIGGVRYFHGPVLGAILLTYMQSNLSDYSEAWPLYLGSLFIAIIMFAPSGLAGMLDAAIKGARDDDAGRRFIGWLGKALSVAVGYLGFILVVELAVRRSSGYGEAFEPLGMHFAYEEWTNWAIGLAMIGVAILAHRLLRAAFAEKRSVDAIIAEMEQAK